MRTSILLVLLSCLFILYPFSAAYAVDSGAAGQLELRYWDDVIRMNTVEAYEAYLKTYPTGTFTSLARLNIRQLKQSQQLQRPQQPSSVVSNAPPPITTVPDQQTSPERFAAPPTQAVDRGRCVQGDCLNGTGTFDYANGDRYSGSFLGGRKHGQGEYRYANGAVYEGEFQNGAAVGQGTINYPDGSRYVGRVENGRMAGEGILYLPNGSTIRGNWQQGHLLSD